MDRTDLKSDTELAQPRSVPVRSVYIIKRRQGGIKIGCSADPSNRRSTLQSGNPDRLDLIWSGEFEDAAAVEGQAKLLLRPWRISGEWFDTSPFIAGMAIEAARDQNAHIGKFLARMATCYASRPDWNAEAAHEAEVERDFPDLYARLSFPEREQWKDWTGKTHFLPHKQFTRIIVGGFPDTTYGCPPAPWHRPVRL